LDLAPIELGHGDGGPDIISGFRVISHLICLLDCHVLLFFVVFFFLVFLCLFFIMFHGLGGIPLIGWLGLFAVRSKVVMTTTLEALSEAGCGSLMCRDVIFSSLGFKDLGRFARRRLGSCKKFVVVDQDVYSAVKVCRKLVYSHGVIIIEVGLEDGIFCWLRISYGNEGNPLIHGFLAELFFGG
jgi:hypothetical protein